MEFSVFVIAGAFACSVIIVALRIDHQEWLYRRKDKKRGSDKDAA